MSAANSKVLLVDDDPSMLRLLSRWLERAGYDVRTADDGGQALSVIAQDCPNFIVTDWEMPRMSGIELCRAVRGLNLPHYVYIVFLTVKSASSEIIAGLEVGADDFLAKPVNQGELLARLRAGTRLLDLERRLSRMACTDSLTGLLTQRSFFESLDKEWNRAGELGRPLSCVMCDIDYFKRVNDMYGHPAGDAVLRTFAQILAGNCRPGDIVSRYGGEEFCVMLPDTTERGAVAWAESIRRTLSVRKIACGVDSPPVTCSFGVSQRYPDTLNAEMLVDQADQGLLCAKRSGRDRVIAFQSLNDGGEQGIDGRGAREDLFANVTAKHVMTPLVASMSANETVGQAAEFFLRSRTNSAPVVDADGKLTGMLSEKDLMSAIVSIDFWTKPVREVMKPNVIYYTEETPVRIIYDFLCRVSLRRIVIVREGRPVGTISRGTLLRWFRNLVIAKGLLDDRDVAADVVNPGDARQRLAETAKELSRRSAWVEAGLEHDSDDLLPLIVGGASDMQELVNDLLAYSRYVGSSCGAAAQRAMLAEGNSLD